jgi:L,D-transpeptidase-like protein
MRRDLIGCSAVLATAAVSLGLCAGTAAATSSAPAGHAVTSASGLAGPTGAPAALARGAAAPAKKPTTTTPTKPSPPKPSPPKPAPAPTPAPAPAPPIAVKAAARLYLSHAFFIHRETLIVPGRVMHVTGAVHPYVPGQTVTFKVFLGHKLIAKQQLRIKLSPNKRYGRFTTLVRASRTGTLHLQATHARTAQMLGFQISRGVASLDPHAGFGARGAFVALIQQRLAAVHMYIPQSGVYDEKTGLAIDAYHRLMGQGTAQSLDGQTVSELLDGRGAFRVRYRGDGKHVEANLGSQLLALIDGAKVQAIYPISSGKPSTPTILGRFHVYLRTPGYLPDGMYYSNFFTGGYAIHGYDPAPDYPASHGCLRLPITDAISVWDWLSIGVPVDVYE